MPQQESSALGVSTPRAAGRRKRVLQPAGWLWILPALIFSSGLIYYCIGYTVYISTLEWDGIGPNPSSIGFENYLRAFADPIFWRALSHTGVYLIIAFTGQALLGFLWAVLLHSQVRLKSVYKVVIFVPVIIAPAIMAPVFRDIFADDGLINEILRFIGLGAIAQPWLAQSSTALGVIIVIAIWQYSGFFFILYYAAMSQVETEVLEAARLDGASNLRVIRSIIWPAVQGTTLALAILSAIASLKLFDIPQLVTGGGPNNSTEFLGTYIYEQSILLFDAGYGAAISVCLLVLSLIVAVILRTRGTRESRKA
jgi:raffinose/stachyose/melibiose transport system permease protein